MTVKGSYLTAAVISLLIHIILIALVSLLPTPAVETTAEESPPPIEIEIIPPQLIDTGVGELQFAQKGPAPEARQEEKQEPAEIKENLPKAVPEEVTESLPPALPEDPRDKSVVLPWLEPQGMTGGFGDERASAEKYEGASETGESGSEEAGGDTGEGDTGYQTATLTAGSRPRYPRSARREGREGVVMIRVLVETDGRPVSVTVRETSGYEDFDRAAVKAVKRWRFSPAMRGGEPVPGFHDVKVRFCLDETG